MTRSTTFPHVLPAWLLAAATVLGFAFSAHAQTLTPQEEEYLTFMREEEKLARDVYTTLGEAWDLPVFAHIAAAEQRHTNATAILLDRYEVVDPMTTNDVGVFTNPDLQALYGQLIEQGAASESAALRVGALIEEIDLLDLEVALANTDHIDIEQVYANLSRGTRNHLRAFVSQLLSVTGEVYEPLKLDVEQYEQIIDSPMERGGRHDRGDRRGRGGRGQQSHRGAGMGGGGMGSSGDASCPFDAPTADADDEPALPAAKSIGAGTWAEVKILTK